MSFQAFIDESGGKGQTRVFTMAGWLSSSARWTQFSHEWLDCLGRHPPIRCFKMREAASLAGEFRGISPAVRDRKLRELAAIVRIHATAAFHCTLDLQGFADTISRLGKPFSDPYFWPFHITIMALCFDSIDRGSTTPIDVVFDEQSIFRPRAMPWYPVVRAFMNEPAEAAVMPLMPIFSTDAQSPPLQAADMLAWLIRRTMNEQWNLIEACEETGELDLSQPSSTNAFEWLVQEELNLVELSPHCQFLTRQRLDGIVSLMKHYLATDFENAPIPPGVDDLLRELVRRSAPELRK